MTATALPSGRVHGFTLIELLVVVVILGILAGLAGLSSDSGNADALELGTIQVQDAVERAQALAISTRSPHGVVFDTAGNRLAIVDNNGDEIVDPLTKRDYIVDFVAPGQPGIGIDQAAFGAMGHAIVFDPQGVPLNGGQLTLSRKGVTLQLTLNPATGELE